MCGCGVVDEMKFVGDGRLPSLAAFHETIYFDGFD